MLERPISKAGWTEVALGDVVENINEYFDRDNDEPSRYVAGEHVDEGKLTVSRWGMTDDGFFPPTFKRRFRAGDVLFHSRNIKKVASPDFHGVTGEKLFVLRAKAGSALMQDLLPYLLSGADFFDYAEQNWSGSVNKFFNWRPLANYRFSLPPIQEQARLVEVLIAALDSSENMLGLIEATRVAQIAAFEELLRRADAKPVSLGSIMTASPRNGYSPVAASRETGHWVLALSAISKWGYRPDQFKPVEVGPETLGSRIAKGDLVISRSNTRDLVGLPMVFPEDRSDVSYPDTMMRISVDPKTIGTDYLEMCLRSPKCRRQV